MEILVDDHPLLDLHVFVSSFERPLGELPREAGLREVLSACEKTPLKTDDNVREAVRGLLRLGGFKPTGRSKPASEYLLKAAAEGRLGTINPAVDIANAVSLYSGLPISVIDLDRARAPFRVRIAPIGSAYVFNVSGQSLDLNGLLCLCDAEGPCANAVKDAQRTKTDGATRSTLSLVWGTKIYPGRAQVATTWYQELLSPYARTETCFPLR